VLVADLILFMLVRYFIMHYQSRKSSPGTISR